MTQNDSYSQFVARKLKSTPPVGLNVDFHDYGMFPHQRDFVRFALRRGRSAIFADTGLGKTRMQIAWADTVLRETKKPIMILAPLAVAQQTVEEAASVGVTIAHAHDDSEVTSGINITNYDRLHKFDPERFGAVVLDESSCIKHHSSKTLQMLLDAFSKTPYRLCATATPAPNDWTELGTHAEFLGIRSRSEMLAEFFVHDGGDTAVWRLKGHARHIFWRWVASWGVMLRSPADLGYDASAYQLPPLAVHQHTVESSHDQSATGLLFAMEAQSLMDRRNARRDSLVERVRACALHIKNENAKLAENVYGVISYGLEEGICRGSENEVAVRSGVQEKKERAVCEGQRSSQTVHEGVLREESGEVQEANPGETSGVQREAQTDVCGGCGETRHCSPEGEGVASLESGKEEVAATEEIRYSSIGLQGHAGDAERIMCDLRLFRHEQSELLPIGRSLPCNWEGSRTALHELQSGAREVQGRQEQAIFCNSLPVEKWVVWCDLNAEQDALECAFKNAGISYVSIRGSTDFDIRIQLEREWRLGSAQVIISKSSIFGWGLNWQHCARMAFVGVTDSWEAYYQAVRRCWRFGQKRSVDVHIFSSEQEGAVVANLRRKEEDAKKMAESLAREVVDSVRLELTGTSKETNEYAANRAVVIPDFLKEV